MPDYRARARRAATRYGLDPHIFERQIGAESNYDPDVISGRRASGAGAQGIAQIMPATARGWGVDPLDPDAALNAAAKNMAAYVRKYGGYENALRAYNAGPAAIEASRGYRETNAYVSKILGGRDPGDLSAPQDDDAPAPAAAKAPGPVTAALAAITLPQRRRPTITGPQANRTSETFYRTPETAGAPQRERFEPGAVLEAIRALQPQASDAGAPPSDSGSPASGGSTSTGTGTFKIEGPDPDRLKPELVSFAEKVAGVAGEDAHRQGRQHALQADGQRQRVPALHGQRDRHLHDRRQARDGHAATASRTRGADRRGDATQAGAQGAGRALQRGQPSGHLRGRRQAVRRQPPRPSPHQRAMMWTPLSGSRSSSAAAGSSGSSSRCGASAATTRPRSSTSRTRS